MMCVRVTAGKVAFSALTGVCVCVTAGKVAFSALTGVCVCVTAGKELVEQQCRVENVDCLPTLTVSDINQHAERDPVIVKHKGYICFCCL